MFSLSVSSICHQYILTRKWIDSFGYQLFTFYTVQMNTDFENIHFFLLFCSQYSILLYKMWILGIQIKRFIWEVSIPWWQWCCVFVGRESGNPRGRDNRYRQWERIPVKPAQAVREVTSNSVNTTVFIF